MNAIVDAIKEPKTTVYGWIRHIDFRQTFWTKAHTQRRQTAGLSNRIAHAKKRESWREEGRQQARLKGELHLMGCMLYWAEGAKGPHSVIFVNSDLAMNKLFLRFLIDEMGVEKSKIKIGLHCYTDVHSVVDIQAYWCQELGLKSEQFGRPVVNPYPQAGTRPSQKKRVGKLPYGTLRLVVCDTRLIHRIYGALEVYGNVFYHPQPLALDTPAPEPERAPLAG